VAGWGRIAANHLDALRSHGERVELVAVCDPSASAREAAAQQTGAPVFASLATLLAQAKPDLVCILTPSGLHPQLAIESALAGCHVLTEKPMATRWDEAQAMVKACDEAGVELFVVKQNRLNPTVQALKAAITQGRFGRIHMVTINVFWQRPQSYYDASPWRGTERLDGGAFLNQASHYMDMLQWLAGPVSAVACFKGTLGRRIEMEDTGVLAFRLLGGGMGSINVTMLTHPRNLEGSITVIGEQGTVRLGGAALNRIEHWEFAGTLPEDEHIMDRNYQPASVYGSGHRAYYANVLDTLTASARPHTDGREGLNSLALILAAYESARTGQFVMPGNGAAT
jgi:UDP-N-acetyl-2-amino-2-deoxyglucuronate dehydrogenase